MDKRTIDKINAAAKNKYNGSLDTAIAAHLMGDVVIDYCGGQVPAGADLDAIATIKKRIKASGKPPSSAGGKGGGVARKKSSITRPRRRAAAPAKTAVRTAKTAKKKPAAKKKKTS
jgi:hypothetical protein